MAGFTFDPIQPVNALGIVMKVDEAKRQNRLLELAQQTEQQKQAQLTQDAQAKAQQANIDRHKALSDILQNGVPWADTPEKWQQLQQYAATRGFGQEAQQYGFDQRDVLMAARNLPPEKWGGIQQGVDPKTNQPGFFQVNEQTGVPRPVQGYAPVPKDSSPNKPDIKPIYSLDGKPMGTAVIDTSNGSARVGNMELQPGQYTTEKPSMGASAPSAEARLKAAQYSNAKASADEYRKLVLSADGKSFNDFAARTPAAKRLLRDAIASKLRGDSGGAISNEEIDNETERWMASIFSSDATNIAAVNRLFTQLDALSGALVGQADNSQPQPEQSQNQIQPTVLVPAQGVAAQSAPQTFTTRSGARVTIENR